MLPSWFHIVMVIGAVNLWSSCAPPVRLPSKLALTRLLIGLIFRTAPPKTSITFFDEFAFTIALPIAGIAVAIDAPNN